jgi:ubiquinone biosynthesis protein
VQAYVLTKHSSFEWIDHRICLAIIQVWKFTCKVILLEGGSRIFEKRIRHLQRYRDIIKALSRYGFGYIAMELGLHEILSLPRRILLNQQKEIKQKTTGERIRLFMEDLGPTFVKLGQFASTRPDVLQKDIIIELEKLQSNVGAFPSKEAIEILEKELEAPIENLFSDFREKPVAAASIGQVHYAVLKTGEPVAVKIQRPNIHANVKTDLEILKDIASLAERRLEIAARYNIVEIIDEFARSLKAELNYLNEGRNSEKIKQQFEGDSYIHIPDVYWDYTTEHVLTAEFIPGTKLEDVQKLEMKGYDPSLIAEHVVKAMFHQIFIDGFFHGDPHPGNIMALPGEKTVFIDFGSVGRLTGEMKDSLSMFVIALRRQHTDGIIHAINRMGMIPDDVDTIKLNKDVEKLRDKYYDIPLSHVSLGDAINELFTVAYQHHIRIPADLTLLGKALLTMEGMVERMDPELSIVKMAEPFGKQLLKERYQPKRIAENVLNELFDYRELLKDLPKNIQEVKSVVKKGKVRLEVSVPKLEDSLKKMDRISNRLAFSIVLLAFSIIMTGLIIGSAIVSQTSPIWNIPVIELGFIVAAGMFIWILYAIFRSGRF